MLNFESAVTDPVTFGELLSKAKTEIGYALCNCTTPPQKLVIRRKHSDSGDKYFLATWPNNGDAHNPNCRFFVSEKAYADNAEANRLAAIQENNIGFQVNADFSMRRCIQNSTAPGKKLETADKKSTDNDQRSATGLLGTLQYLWRRAGLNNCNLESRNWRSIVANLNTVISNGKIGKHSISEILYIIPVFEHVNKEQNAQKWHQFFSKFERTAEFVPSFLILGEIKNTILGEQCVITNLRNFPYSIYMTESFAKSIAKKFPVEESFLRSEDNSGRVVGLFLVEKSVKGNLAVSDVALMLVSNEYIPCDSHYELRLANKLVAEKRVFEKPTTPYPAIGIMPDFVLLDTHFPIYIEVWGMQTPEYLERKAEKIRQYDEQGLDLWQWDAISSRLIPDLPPVAFSK